MKKKFMENNFDDLWEIKKKRSYQYNAFTSK